MGCKAHSQATTRMLEAAAQAAAYGAFGALPNPLRKPFVDALEAAMTQDGLTLAQASTLLHEHQPKELPSLEGAMREWAIAPDGLGIDTSDLPQDAMEYLSLVLFLRAEMDAGHLPYADFQEMAHAAEAGISRAQGLAPTDCEALVRTQIAPLLRRLWPSNEPRVQAECDRLLEVRN